MTFDDHKTVFAPQAKFWMEYSKFKVPEDWDRRTLRMKLQDMLIFIHQNWPEACTCSQCEEDRTYIANIKPPAPLR